MTEAQTAWFNTGTGTWQVASNWTSGVPTSSIDASFSIGGIAQVRGAILAQARILSIGASTGGSGRVELFSVGTGIPILQVSDLRIAASSSSTGSLDVTLGGRVTSSSSVIGLFSGSAGTVNINGFNPVTGSSSTWFAEGGTFDVGDLGTGILNVTGSGELRTNSATLGTRAIGSGTVTVAGSTFTKWLVNSGNINIGPVGTGKLTLADQSQIQFTGSGGSVVIGANGTFNFGTFTSNGAGTPGTLVNATSIANGGAFNLDHTGTVTLTTPVTGAGQITHVATGTTTLSNVSAFTGGIKSRDGVLIVNGTTSASTLVADGPGILRLQNGTLSLGTRSILANSGGIVEYKDETINGGYLRGSGSHNLMAGSTNAFNGVTTFNSTNIIQDGIGNFTNFQNGGRFFNNSIASFDGAVNLSSGNIDVNSTLNAFDFTSQGILSINSGGTVVNTIGNLVAGGGSRTHILAGGEMSLQNGTELDLNGALLVNNGIIDGTTNVHFGSLAKGAGTYGTVNIFDGGTFSPGNSPGEAIINGASFLAGGALLFEIHDALGAPGIGYDTLNIVGELNLAAGTTANSQFLIDIASLDANNNAGLAINFAPGRSFSFLLASAHGGINGFSTNQFHIDSSRFRNDLGSGFFSLTQSGNELRLNFSSVPEPHLTGLFLITGLTLSGYRRRRN